MGITGVAGADAFSDGQKRLSSWMPDKLPGCRQWLEVTTGRMYYFTHGRGSTRGSDSLKGVDDIIP